MVAGSVPMSSRASRQRILTMNQLDFAKRTAVITGGAAGIGFAIAQRLVPSGATVSLWDRDAAALARAEAALGRGTLTQALDVADAEAVSRAAQDAERALGKIDVLVCSAGITGPNTTTWEYPVDAWRQVIDVNLNGLFYCNRAVVPAMLKNDLRTHRQHRVGRRQGGQSERVGLQRVEGRRDRPHQVARQGAREDRHSRQLRDARGGAHGDLRPDVAAAHRLHAVEDPARAIRRRRRDRRARLLARKRGLQLLDGRGVRSVGRHGRRTERGRRRRRVSSARPARSCRCARSIPSARARRRPRPAGKRGGRRSSLRRAR